MPCFTTFFARRGGACPPRASDRAGAANVAIDRSLASDQDHLTIAVRKQPGVDRTDPG